MGIKAWLRQIAGLGNYDRLGEHLIKKSLRLYHRGGRVNQWRSIRLYNKIRRNFNCSVPPWLEIGENLYIAHAHDIYIGKTAIIGNNCRIYPSVEIAATVVGDEERREQGFRRRHAKIGNDCLIGVGCIILGPIEIGDDVTIAAGAVVTKDVPAHSVVKKYNEIRPKRPDELTEACRTPQNSDSE